jgi:signal transduction histidine kinase
MSIAAKWRILDRWFDVALAVALLVAFTINLFTVEHLHGPLALNLLVAGAISLATVWRRQAPLAYTCVVMGLGVVMTATLTDITSLVVPTFVLFVPPYTVAAYEGRRRAVLGLAVCLGATWALDVIATPRTVSNYLFTGGLVTASWAAGRALRARRLLNEELERKAVRIAAERESRERLAVADERTRIARELHAVVAGNVSAMVVQTGAALQLLDIDPGRADEAMAAVESAGRETLADMRRILGVLRRADEAPNLGPQPGVGQIHQLVELARANGREVEFAVAGEPGPLPASVDLGLYRILEEALAKVAPGDVAVRLRFTKHDVELEMTSPHAVVTGWPTMAMRERTALCGGELEADDRQLRVRLPREFGEVLVS